MIGSLRGTVLDRTTGPNGGELLVEAGGVGYRVLVPTTTLRLASLAGPVFVHVHTHVREDAIILYGFGTRDERLCFEALLTVHGVGPALALGLLSTHSPAALRRIVATEDADALTLVPGVGKKTAVRLLLELAAKLDAPPDGDGLVLAGSVGTGGDAEATADPRAEVRAALAGLGYGADEVRDAVRQLPDDGEVEDLLRSALRQLAAVR